MRFTFTTALRPGQERAYETVHRSTPEQLDSVIRSAGAHAWRIERSGLTLFHFVEAEDIARFSAVLDDSEVHAAWQQRVSPLLEDAPVDYVVVTEFSLGRGDFVWQLPDPA
jgi:L-rhamnose mutarotase